MKLSLITKNNYNAFGPMLFDGTGPKAARQIRFGAVCDGEAAGAISFLADSTKPLLTSLYVAPHRRRQKVADAMLTFAENRFAEEGKMAIEANFPDDAEGLLPFLEDRGYFCSIQQKYYRIFIKDLAGSPQVKTLMSKKSAGGLTVIPWADMSKIQRSSVLGLIAKRGSSVDPNTLPELDAKLSSAVFDNNGDIQMCMISSSNTGMIFVEQLSGISDQRGLNPNILHAQLSAFFRRIVTRMQKKKANYREIHFLAENEGIVEFLDRILGEGRSPEEVAGLVYAVKAL